MPPSQETGEVRNRREIFAQDNLQSSRA